MSNDAKHLRVLMPPDSTVYSVVVHQSRTGTTCRVLFLAIADGSIVNINAAVADLLGVALEHGHALLAGPAATAGQRLTPNLARALHGNQLALKHKALV
jgi:hypothetical protein